MDISRDDFAAYERIRESGVTNMFDTRAVAMLTGLDRPVIHAIMAQYTELMGKYPDVRSNA